MSPADLFVLVVVAAAVVVRPVLGWRERRRGVTPGLGARLAYLCGATTLVGLAASLAGLQPADAGLVVTSAWRMALITVAGVALVIAADAAGARALVRQPGLLNERTAALGAWVRGAAPGRLRLMIYIAGAAAYEEIVFRGLGLYLTTAFGLPLPIAVLLLALAFGLQHSAGGWLGMGYACLFGLFFSALYLAAGSLFAAVIAHAAGNAYTVLWTYPRLVRRLERRRAPAFLF